MIGSVKIRRNGTVNWISAKVGMPLRERDGIRTFVESEAELETSEGTIMKVGENSTLELSKFQQDENTQNSKVKIMNGNVISNVKKLVSTSSSFEFETPTATAAIRGTIIGIDVNKEATNVKVYEGRVYVTPKGARKGVELKENQMSTINRKTKEIKIEQFSTSKPVIDTLATNNSDSTIINVKSPLLDSSSLKNSDDSIIEKTDSTGTIENDTSDTELQSKENTGNTPLKLSVSSPIDGSFASASSPVSVNGVVSPSNALVMVNGKKITVSSSGAFNSTIPIQPGEDYFEININADYNGTSQNIVRSVKIKKEELVLNVTSPKDKQIFSKSIIPISGTVTAGSDLSVMSIKIPVTSQGGFNSQIPIPNEEGEYTIEFEANLDGKYQKTSRTVCYKPEYRFILSYPQDRQIINSTLIQIKGELQPSSSTISVQGKKIPVSSNGNFSGFLNIPDEEGEIVLEFDIVSGGISKNERRTIIYKRPPDTYIPQLQGVLPLSSVSGKIPFTVIDRTIDEEITFYYEVDGSKEFQTGQPNTPFYLSLVEGIHNYKVYAVDKKGNSSQVLNQTISYLGSSIWNIRLRKPAGDLVLNLPPSTPDGNYKPEYPLEFSIEDLPDNNIKLIKEIIVVNSTNSEKVEFRNLTDIYVEAELVLTHRATNVITIEAIDVNNNRKTRKFNIHVR